MRRFFWIIGCIGLVGLGWFLNGAVMGKAQGQKAEGEKAATYSYLNELYNKPYIPTYADWKALEFTANENFTGYLTNKLIKRECRLSRFFPDFGIAELGAKFSPHALLSVDLHTQPTWDVYLGNGRFSVSDREVRAALQEGADEILKRLRHYFHERSSGLQDREIRISFSMHGTPIGTWENGKVKLPGE